MITRIGARYREPGGGIRLPTVALTPGILASAAPVPLPPEVSNAHSDSSLRGDGRAGSRYA